MGDEVCLCVGICLPDEDEAYCIGCGRPWGAPIHGVVGDGTADPPASDEQYSPSETSG